MRILVVMLLVVSATPAYAQQKFPPQDGNGLLDYCGVMVTGADNPATLTALSGDAFTEAMKKFAWCTGYLQAVHDAAIQTEVNIFIISKLGVTLQGPDNKIKEYAFNALRGVCIPEKVPLLQLARVVVKWLQGHPERLHENLIATLVKDAINDAFPCTPITAQEPTKPQDAKPAAPKP